MSAVEKKAAFGAAKRRIRGPLLARAALAALLAMAVASVAVVASPGVASAASGHGAFSEAPDCGTTPNCVMIPTPSQDSAFGVDHTGSTEVSYRLMYAVSRISVRSPHTAANPLTLMLQPGGTYNIDYTLQLANVLRRFEKMWPNFPTFNLNNTTLDLNGSTLDQRNYDTSDPRVQTVGNPILSTNGVSNVTVKNGTLENTAFGVTHPRRGTENWQGIRVGGKDGGPSSAHLTFSDLTIRKPGGDFIEIFNVVDDINIRNNIMTNAGRQGVTIQNGTNVNILNNDIRGTRITFDSEPAGANTIGPLTIAGNTGEAGKLAYFQSVEPAAGTIHGILIASNTISGGNPSVLAYSRVDVARQNFTFTRNTVTACWARNPPMFAHPVETEGWYGVNVSDNTWNIKYNADSPLSWDNRFPNIVAPSGGPWPGEITTPSTYNQC